MQWLCSSSSFPERIDSSFWYWGLEKIEASEWEPPWYPFQERWQHSLGLYLQRLPLIYKPKAYLLLNHHWCAAQVQWVQVFTKLNIAMHLNWIMSPGKSVSLLYPWQLSIFIDCLWKLITSFDIAKAIMETVLHDTPDGEVYLDDVWIFCYSREAHLQVLEQAPKVQDNNFILNTFKCKWAV